MGGHLTCYYRFDEQLDDALPWRTTRTRCADCGYAFVAVTRIDQPLECPRCTADPARWSKHFFHEA